MKGKIERVKGRRAMSKSIELLNECKAKLGIKTDYKLAKEMQIERMRISDYMKGKRTPDNYACMRIALILNKNPTEILALVETETEKNPKKKAFWIDFLRSAKEACQGWKEITNFHRGEERRKETRRTGLFL